MRHDAQLKSAGYVGKSAERKLVRAVQHRRPEIAVGMGIVEGTDPVVLIRRQRAGWPTANGAAAILEPRQRIRNLQVKSTHASKRVLYVLDEFGLQTVVHGTANGQNEGKRWRTGIDSGECASVATGRPLGADFVELAGRGQTVPREITHQQGTGDAVWIGVQAGWTRPVDARLN